MDDDERTVLVPNTPGELRIKGPQLFSEYLNRPDATRDTFDTEGWFKTGDIAEVAPDGYYKILGRSSSDIIKVSFLFLDMGRKQIVCHSIQVTQTRSRYLATLSVTQLFAYLTSYVMCMYQSAGYKLSALEIERELLAHPQVSFSQFLCKGGAEFCSLSLRRYALNERLGWHPLITYSTVVNSSPLMFLCN